MIHGLFYSHLADCLCFPFKTILNLKSVLYAFVGERLGLVPAYEFAPQKHGGKLPDYIECAPLISIIKDKYKTNSFSYNDSSLLYLLQLY